MPPCRPAPRQELRLVPSNRPWRRRLGDRARGQTRGSAHDAPQTDAPWEYFSSRATASACRKRGRGGVLASHFDRVFILNPLLRARGPAATEWYLSAHGIGCIGGDFHEVAVGILAVDRCHG